MPLAPFVMLHCVFILRYSFSWSKEFHVNSCRRLFGELKETLTTTGHLLKHMSRHVLPYFRYLCFKCGYKAMLNIAMEPKFPSTYNFSTFLESKNCSHKRRKFYTYA